MAGVADAPRADRPTEGEQTCDRRERHPEAAEVQRSAGHGADRRGCEQASNARDRVVDAGRDAGGALVGVGEDRRRERRDDDRESEREDRRTRLAGRARDDAWAKASGTD